MINLILAHRKRIGVILASLTIAAIAVATLPPSRQLTESTPWCLVCGTLGGVDVTLNVLMFIPLGLGVAFAGGRAAMALPAMCLLSLSIEVAQLLIPGRDPTISDLITNSLGGAIGFAVGSQIDLLLKPRPTTAIALSLGWLGAWVLLQAAFAYIAIPAATDSRYYGQIKRALGFRRPWPGDVVSATLNDLTIPNTAFRNSDAAAAAINGDSGARFDVMLVPRGHVNGMTSIVRIADSNAVEVAMIAQDRTDLVFGVRTRGIDARLRPAYFAMRDVFPSLEASRDTLRIRARHSRDAVLLSVARGNEQRDVRIQVSSATSWRRFMPARVYADGSMRGSLYDVLWIAACLTPALFWFFAAGTDAMRTRRWMVAALVAVGSTVPFMIGVAPPGSTEFAGLSLALLLGFLLGRRSSSLDPKR